MNSDVCAYRRANTSITTNVSGCLRMSKSLLERFDKKKRRKMEKENKMREN